MQDMSRVRQYQSSSACPFPTLFVHGVQRGFSHIFCRLPCDLADYRVLSDSLAQHGADVTKQRSLHGVVMGLKTTITTPRHEEEAKAPHTQPAMLRSSWSICASSESSRRRPTTLQWLRCVVSHGRKIRVQKSATWSARRWGRT